MSGEQDPHEPEQVAEILRTAAQFAERQTTVRKAVAVAWNALHLGSSPSKTHLAFEAWCASEGMTRSPYLGFDIPSLGELLRRRYKNGSAQDISDSLRKAQAAKDRKAAINE